ncbi:XVIPCD domain-containing protein [Lysobacter antibioticus]|uniref:XVIPCD domain-containing protein n=1 Tax=Lysobacter antibioticus TaxID=84531 RepID=UPI0007E8C21A|nr:XVIPCD domain-containing protein [Lysobacter antibioticus]
MDRRESLFHEFGRDGASKQQLELIAKTIASSPKLNHELTRAIDAGDIGRLGYVARNSSADGTYDSTHRALNLSPRVLDQPETRRTLDRLASVMGHEVSHAMQRADAFSANVRFVGQVQELAQSNLARRDYTAIVANHIQSDRRQEALAELNGMNTLADRMRNAGETVTAEAFALRARPHSACVTGMPGSLDPRVCFDSTAGAIPVDAANIDAVASCFYDIARTKGEYRYDTAAYAISMIAQKEFEARRLDPDRSPTGAELDLKSLGLDPQKLRAQSFDFGPMRDGPFYLVDTSSQPRQVIELRHTPRNRDEAKHLQGPSTAQDPSHLDHRLYQQAIEGVAALDRALGKAPDAGSERLAASLLGLAKENGLQRIDHVVLSQGGTGLRPGENVFVVQGALDDPAHLRAHMKTEQAVATPVEASMQRLEAVNQRLGEQQSLAGQQLNDVIAEPARPGLSR